MKLCDINFSNIQYTYLIRKYAPNDTHFQSILLPSNYYHAFIHNFEHNYNK